MKSRRSSCRASSTIIQREIRGEPLRERDRTHQGLANPLSSSRTALPREDRRQVLLTADPEIRRYDVETRW
jgi:hypothetical protein